MADEFVSLKNTSKEIKKTMQFLIIDVKEMFAEQVDELRKTYENA